MLQGDSRWVIAISFEEAGSDDERNSTRNGLGLALTEKKALVAFFLDSRSKYAFGNPGITGLKKRQTEKAHETHAKY